MFDYRRVGCNSKAFNEVWEPLRTSILATYLPDLGRIILCLILHGFRLEVHVVGLSHHSAPVEVGKPRWTLSSLQMHSDRGKSVRMYLYIYIYYIYIHIQQKWSFHSFEFWLTNSVLIDLFLRCGPRIRSRSLQQHLQPWLQAARGVTQTTVGEGPPPLLWFFTHPTVDLRFSHKSNH